MYSTKFYYPFRSVAEIQKELVPIKHYLDRLEKESGGSYEKVGKEFYEKKAKFDEISESLAKLQSFFVVRTFSNKY